MPAYETEGFSPPAPVVRSLMRGPEGQVYQDVPLLLDSGVDVTVLPLHVANAVGAVRCRRKSRYSCSTLANIA